MKKTLLTCLAVAVLLAVASSAFAITCTIDQRPAATLLVPYFQVSYGPLGELISTGPFARDTIVTIANASSAPMIAHVNLFDRESNLKLDFNVALTGFDVQAMRMSDIIGGNLPNTVNSDGDDTCQRNASASVYPDPDGFLRVRPLVPATGQDNSQATTDYTGIFNLGNLITELRWENTCDDPPVVGPLAIGYLIIDHVNYCNLSDPTDGNYYYNDAIGMENNLWGEIIFTSGAAIPTYAMSTVNVEADASIGNASQFGLLSARSFDARYWNPLLESAPGACPNCGACAGIPPSSNPLDVNFLNCRAPWDQGFGDQREPLGLRWAARWFNAGLSLTSNFRVWRAGTAINGNCVLEMPIVTLRFYDEDEQTTSQGVCPSPCTNPTFNFPVETQQRNISDFSTPGGAVAGWVQFDFLNLGSGGTEFDQAWADYSFEGLAAFESILVPGTQLDPSSCNPEGTSIIGLTEPIAPVIPAVVGTGVTS